MSHVSALVFSTRWRWLLWSFARREIVTRYMGSLAGLGWTLFHPAIQLALYAFVFSVIFRVELPKGYGASYLAFVAVALWPWLMFTEALLRATGALQANAGLLAKVAFPRQLLVYAAVFASYVVNGVGFLAVLVLLALAGEPVRLAAIPLAVVLLVPYLALAAGIGAVLAAFQVVLRDVEHGVASLLTFLFYATPILYPVTLVPEALRGWIAINPFAQFSERLREVLLLGSGLQPGDATLFLLSFVVLAAGFWFFERLAPHFEDFL